jgi:hypothetical protein
MNEYDKKYFKVPKASENNDKDFSKLELQQKLAKKRHEYGPMLKQLFTDRRVFINFFCSRKNNGLRLYIMQIIIRNFI